METFCYNPENELQKKLAYSFSNPELLIQALTHSSWANEHGSETKHNQRLEFLGDAVLELCISDSLYQRYPEAREGALTKLRASLVREGQLAEIARKLGIPQALHLGKGEECQNGRDKDSLLADSLEAVLAAVYLDGGFKSAQLVISHIFSPYWPQRIPVAQGKDAKSRIQEICQKVYKSPPTYTLLHATGPDHAKTFEVQLVLPDGRIFYGRAQSCKKAQQEAALHCLEQMGIVPSA